jgi:uncharacterized protein YbbC (DUF1343 family)
LKTTFLLQNTLFFCLLLLSACGQSQGLTQSKNKITQNQEVQDSTLYLGAERFEEYLPLLKNKKVALLINQTSRVDSVHLVDFLLEKGVEIKKIFAPEHGFRGKASAGEQVKDSKDLKTGLEIISLYGKNKKPTKEQLEDIDLVVFDIQDVGLRFYTYISTMHYLMESCAENNKKCLILDRPNPNGQYIDGAIREEKYKSFVGMHPIPIVHGLTVGELAKMINGQGWLRDNVTCDLTVIPCKNYTHEMPYSLKVKPSPNLPNDRAIDLYASLCLFEGTIMTLGRGTDFPFQVIGHPDLPQQEFSFTPKANQGAKYPKFEGKKCFAYDLRLEDERKTPFSLHYLIETYELMGKRKDFFNPFFSKLAGTAELQQQIERGMSEAEIKKTWQKDLEKYKTMREKYLLYH